MSPLGLPQKHTCLTDILLAVMTLYSFFHPAHHSNNTHWNNLLLDVIRLYFRNYTPMKIFTITSIPPKENNLMIVVEQLFTEN